MEVHEIKPTNEKSTEETGRPRSPIQFPSYSLAECLAVPKVIHEKGGGYATREQLAAFLDYKSVQNGAFLSRIGAARLFGLIFDEEKKLRPSNLAVKILMPESTDEHKAALVAAFLTVPLFKAIYQEYLGRDLPEGLGLKNALRIKFKVVPNGIDLAYKNLMDSAETAGFFETRGSRTQLIIPVFKQAPKPALPAEPKNKIDYPGGGSGDGEPPPPPAKTRTRDELQNDYIGTLIEVLREKSKQGEMDNELMERIERLLDLKSA